MNSVPSKKSAEYYLGLRYSISLRELAPEEGGGYVATLPQLGSKTFVAVADTQAEALTALEELRQFLIPLLVAEGDVLPEPSSEQESIDQYSGSLMLRVPRGVHAQLVLQAKRNGCSINKLATQLLSQGLTAQAVTAHINSSLREVVADEIRKALEEKSSHPSAINPWYFGPDQETPQSVKARYLQSGEWDKKVA